ncbi:MAG: protein kinase [Candidatus Marinimicrobia bacterium]|nr:protein kinase [Candidatus Neomarinimicrobiota bacterium]
MDFNKRWRLLDETPIGGGGQGKVYRVIDEDRFKIRYDSNNPLVHSLRNLTSVAKESEIKLLYEMFRDEILKMIQMENSENHGALKVLHNPEEARDPELAKDRIKKEIKAMNDISHPNLIEILDYDLDSYWFVSKYYLNGTLEKKSSIYEGNIVKVLNSIRPLVEGVAAIHDAKYVHRDIKSGNIFIDSAGALILGDFGLVYYEDKDHTRLSKTFDKVGSSEWMPPWGNTMKIEEVRPTFDVFSLGKLIWTMISGIPSLPYWYWDKEEYDLTKMFPDNSKMWLVNQLFEKSVVEEEKDCLSNAKVFLEEIDKTIIILGNGVKVMRDENDLIKTKALSLYTSIEKMSDKQKNQLATEDYGKEVNKLFLLARLENPDLTELIPSDLLFDNFQLGGTLVSTPWSEIHSKLLILHNLLD